MDNVDRLLSIAKKVGSKPDNKQLLFIIFFSLIFALEYLLLLQTVGQIKFLLEQISLSIINAGIEIIFPSDSQAMHLYVFFEILIITLTAFPLCYLIFDYFNLDKLMNSRSYTWKSSSGLKDWQFNGVIQFDLNNTLIIKHAELGAVIKNRFWSDYIMSFEFKLPRKISYGPELKANKTQLERGFSVIVRARNVEQYYMIKIDENGFQPHIRNEGVWEIMGNTLTSKRLSNNIVNSWIKTEVKMTENKIDMHIGSLSFMFVLPTHSLIKKIFPTKAEDSFKDTVFTEISYRNGGTVGFRSASFEEVHIRNLMVKPVRKWQKLLSKLSS